MNHFKLLLLSTFLCILSIVQHKAQPLDVLQFETIPSLQITSINYNTEQVFFNELDYETFDVLWLERRVKENSRDMSLIQGPTIAPSTWVIVPDGHAPISDSLFVSNTDYELRLGIVCNNFKFYSDIVTYDFPTESDRLISETNVDIVEFEIYPQPASDFINIESKFGTKIKSIFLYNSNGQMMVTKENEENLSLIKIEFPHLKSGMYIAKIIMENQLEKYQKITVRSN